MGRLGVGIQSSTLGSVGSRRPNAYTGPVVPLDNFSLLPTLFNPGEKVRGRGDVETWASSGSRAEVLVRSFDLLVVSSLVSGLWSGRRSKLRRCR